MLSQAITTCQKKRLFSLYRNIHRTALKFRSPNFSQYFVRCAREDFRQFLESPNSSSINPTLQPSDPKSQPSDPKSQPSDLKSQPSDPKSQPSDPKSQPSDPKSQPMPAVAMTEATSSEAAATTAATTGDSSPSISTADRFEAFYSAMEKHLSLLKRQAEISRLYGETTVSVRR